MLTEEQILDEINKIHCFKSKNRNHITEHKLIELNGMIEAYRNVIQSKQLDIN